uniref:Ig-like domain-containing protein n=1 Tax=Heterorhabditis bacteriophora TaxID=37862 RepID=A0A1I7XH53_HETBA
MLINTVDDPTTRSAVIPQLREETPYTFKIRGKNRLGPGLPSAPFSATTWLGARPPQVSVTPAEHIEKEPSNDELSIECEASGVPKPKIIWLWSGQLVEDGKSSLHICKVQRRNISM